MVAGSIRRSIGWSFELVERSPNPMDADEDGRDEAECSSALGSKRLGAGEREGGDGEFIEELGTTEVGGPPRENP